jgi:hypothetical protein
VGGVPDDPGESLVSPRTDQEVLNVMLMRLDCVAEVVSIVRTSASFAVSSHNVLFRDTVDLHSANQSIDGASRIGAIIKGL